MPYEVCGELVLTPGGPKHNYSVAVDGNRILDVGRTAEIRKKYKFSKSIGGKGFAVTPSFVDAHMHSFQVATKGRTSDKSLLEWLKKYIWKWEGEMGRKQARACAELAYTQLIRCGVATISDYTSVRYADEAIKAAMKLGVRGLIGKTMMDRRSPPELLEDTDASLRETESLIRKYNGAGRGRIRYGVTPRFAITCSEELMLGAKALCEKHGVMFRTHANENREEVKTDKKILGTTSVTYLHRLGILGPNTQLTHCIWLTPGGFSVLKKTNTKVVHCPGSNMLLASGVANVPRMLREGIEVGLGSDVAAYYNVGPFEQMRLACLMQKVNTRNPMALSHNSIFSIATEGSNRVMGIQDAGKIQKGYLADIALISIKRLAYFPLNDLVAQIVYSAYPSSVHTLICNGEILMENRKVLTIDEEKLKDRVKDNIGGIFS